MSFPLLIAIVILFLLLLAGSPVIFAIGAAGLSYFVTKPGAWELVPAFAHTFFTGMDSFIFLCIPLFLLCGEIMGSIGLTEKLVKFAQLVVGRFRGGLAYVNVVDSMIFGGISGSALADISALGPIVIDMMKRDGYDAEFSTALTVTTALQGPVIPPSIPMVIFASLTNVSIGALFLGGIIPGIMIGLAQAVVIRMMVVKHHFPRSILSGLSGKEILGICLNASPALALPIIIIGGIVSGVFTATEASGIAVGYAALLGFVAYKNLPLNEFWKMLNRTARTSAGIYLIIGFATVLSWVFAIERMPDLVLGVFNDLKLSKWGALLVLNLFFLFNGMWVSDIVQLLLFAPLFTPILEKMGVHPVHFGIVMVLNVVIGLATPPYGTALYLGALVGKVSLTKLTIKAIPFILSAIVVLGLVTYIEPLALWIPTLFGLVRR